MTQYLEKSALLAEIEKQIELGKFKCQQSQENGDQESYIAWSEHIATCGKILSFVNTLEVKEVELEKEIELVKGDYEQVNVAWNNDFDFIAKHFFELGIKAQQNISIDITNIDKVIEENGVDPNSKEAKMFKESYYMALEKLKAQKGE